MKKKVRINERQLKQVVNESVKRVLNEMGLVHNKTGKEYNYSRYSDNVNVPPVDDYTWKYNGEDKIDKTMWMLKKKAQTKQKDIDIKNHYAKMIRDGQITKDELYQLANSGKISHNVCCIGVLNGKGIKDVVREDGWPTAEFIMDNIYTDEYADIDFGLSDDYSLEDLYEFCADIDYRNMLSQEDRYRGI